MPNLSLIETKRITVFQKRLRVGGKALALSFRIKMNAAGIEAVTFRGERLAKNNSLW
jgi:hypothetical protein